MAKKNKKKVIRPWCWYANKNNTSNKNTDAVVAGSARI